MNPLFFSGQHVLCRKYFNLYLIKIPSCEFHLFSLTYPVNKKGSLLPQIQHRKTAFNASLGPPCYLNNNHFQSRFMLLMELNLLKGWVSSRVPSPGTDIQWQNNTLCWKQHGTRSNKTKYFIFTNYWGFTVFLWKMLNQTKVFWGFSLQFCDAIGSPLGCFTTYSTVKKMQWAHNNTNTNEKT